MRLDGTICPVSVGCGQGRLELYDERQDDETGIFVGFLRCVFCAALYLDQSREARMSTSKGRRDIRKHVNAKVKAAARGQKEAKPKKAKSRKKPARQAIPEAARELGAGVQPIPPTDDERLKEIGQLNEECTELHEEYGRKAEAAKTAKKAWENKVAFMSKRISELVNGQASLFDAVDHEADRKTLLDAVREARDEAENPIGEGEFGKDREEALAEA